MAVSLPRGAEHSVKNLGRASSVGARAKEAGKGARSALPREQGSASNLKGLISNGTISENGVYAFSGQTKNVTFNAGNQQQIVTAVMNGDAVRDAIKSEGVPNTISLAKLSGGHIGVVFAGTENTPQSLRPSLSRMGLSSSQIKNVLSGQTVRVKLKELNIIAEVQMVKISNGYGTCCEPVTAAGAKLKDMAKGIIMMEIMAW